MSDISEMLESTLSEEEIYRGKIIRVHRDRVALADGTEALREIVAHNGGVCCAALNERGELAFVRQFRYAYGKVVTELPAGKLEKGEDPFDAVQRELREEVGAAAADWQPLGVLYPTPGYCTEVIHLYTCRITSVGDTDFDEDERIESFFIPLDEAAQMVLRGELPDAKTQVLVMKVWMREHGFAE